MHRPHRLVVRTSRRGRDNPGSTPGGVICICWKYLISAKAYSSLLLIKSSQATPVIANLAHKLLSWSSSWTIFKGVWCNGSASDSRSEGWEFESLCPHCRFQNPWNCKRKHIGDKCCQSLVIYPHIWGAWPKPLSTLGTSANVCKLGQKTHDLHVTNNSVLNLVSFDLSAYSFRSIEIICFSAWCCFCYASAKKHQMVAWLVDQTAWSANLAQSTKNASTCFHGNWWASLDEITCAPGRAK